MPTTLVRTNGPESWMLRSTWLSAAKWITESTPSANSGPHGVAVGDVAVDEAVARVVAQVGQVGEVAGVGQRVEVDDGRFGVAFQDIADEVAADEAAAAGDEEPNHRRNSSRYS